jgi:hypothetical protein
MVTWRTRWRRGFKIELHTRRERVERGWMFLMLAFLIAMRNTGSNLRNCKQQQPLSQYQMVPSSHTMICIHIKNCPTNIYYVIKLRDPIRHSACELSLQIENVSEGALLCCKDLWQECTIWYRRCRLQGALYMLIWH